MVSRVLLTGATGFVGRAIRARLSDDSRYVVRSAYRGAKKVNLTGESIEVGDIDGNTDWSHALDGVDFVIHAAARVHVMNSGADEIDAYRSVNREGTLALARQAAAAGAKRMVFLSSAKVNGEMTDPGRPFRADDKPKPEDPYAISKYEAETGLGKIAAETGMEVVIVRPPLVYGPGVGANFLKLIRLVDSGVPLPFGSIDNRRSLVAVGNLADLIVHCLSAEGASGQTFLAGDGEDLSTPDLVRRIAHHLGRPPRLLPVPAGMLKMAGMLTGRSVQVQRLLGSFQIDIEKTRDMLDWQPPVTGNEAMAETVSWFRNRKEQK